VEKRARQEQERDDGCFVERLGWVGGLAYVDAREIANVGGEEACAGADWVFCATLREAKSPL
jgi:hypothetical protein